MASYQSDNDRRQRARRGDTSKKLILLVEDDESNASLLMGVIEQETTHQVVHTTDGKTAWKFLQQVTPHLVILDYRLPGMDDLQLYDRIRGCPALHTVPVMLLSPVLPFDEVKCRGLMSLKKPFDLEDLLRLIEFLISA